MTYISGYEPEEEYYEAMFENLELNNTKYKGKVIVIKDLIQKLNYENISENILELKIIKLNKNLLNLPLGLKKLEIYNKSDNIIIKCPFGCEYIEK